MGSVQAVVTLLGYPSRHTLYEWYRKKIADITDYHGSLDKEYIIKQKYINKPNHPRNPDISLKLDVIKRRFSWRRCRICIKRYWLQSCQYIFMVPQI